MTYLYDTLKTYTNLDIYPFHMPGHKRAGMGRMPESFCQLDITEIDGFDNLHDAHGILKEAGQRASKLYGADETHFVINGSTAGMLAAISGAVPFGSRVLAARNCHKSVYHALYLNHLEAVYVYPKEEKSFCLNGGIDPEDVRRTLAGQEDIKAVIITSPTFDGVVSDVAAIAEAAHAYGIPLIVDEAHGAHFGLHKSFPAGALSCGADVVIHSLHKTLPAPTQTALVHMNGTLADRERIKKYLQIYQSSSPSYPLMAGMDECIRLLADKKELLFTELSDRLDWFYTVSADMRHIRLADRDIAGSASIYDFDSSKLVLSTGSTGMTGRQLYDRLLRDFNIQMEMASFTYCLGIATVADSMDGFCRLDKALGEIDETAGGAKGPRVSSACVSVESACTIAEAEELIKRRVPLKECVGSISGEYICLYPPGIPLIVPGEIVTKECMDRVQESVSQGLTLMGLTDEKAETLLIVENAKK